MAEPDLLYPAGPMWPGWALLAFAGLRYRLWLMRDAWEVDHYRITDAQGPSQGWTGIDRKAPTKGGHVARPAPDGLRWESLEPEEFQAAQAFVVAQSAQLRAALPRR